MNYDDLITKDPYGWDRACKPWRNLGVSQNTAQKYIAKWRREQA